MPSSRDRDPVLALVNQGWHSLQLQQPLAARAAWHRALRLAPDHEAAVQALATLESAADLPAVARTVARFQAPDGPEQRDRWDRRFQGRNLEDLADAAEVFAELAAEGPGDASARFNLALCLAWQGRNSEAIAGLEQVVGLLANDSAERAIHAGTLAEVLRLGAGAEALADDRRFAWVLEWPEGDAPELPDDRPWLVPVPAPLDPVSGQPQIAGARVFEWLDRPIPATGAMLTSGTDLPRLLATVVATSRAIRISSPDPRTLDDVHDPLIALIGGLPPTLRRESIPLPLTLADAAVWTFRLPGGLDPEARQALTRLGVEHYYEDLWIHQPRHALGGRSPLEASRLAAEGDREAWAKLGAVVRFREQLGARPRTARLYQGYPFDRLRRRLGLGPDDPNAIDLQDLSCASLFELKSLDAGTLVPPRLNDAITSALGLRDDPLIASMGAELFRRPASAIEVPLVPLMAALARESARLDRPEEALDWLEVARKRADSGGRRTFAVWTAEIQARTGRADDAARTYETLLGERPDAPLALDAAETFLDLGHPARALSFLQLALEEARRSGDGAVEGKANALMEQVNRDIEDQAP